MPNWGKAFSSAGDSVSNLTGYMLKGKELEQREEELKLKKEKLKQEKLLKTWEMQARGKAAEAAAEKNKIDMKKMAFTALKFAVGEEGISNDRKEAMTNSFQEQFGVDISTLFRPTKYNEKTGVAESYSIENEETVKAKIAQETKEAELKVEKSKVAVDKIKALTDKLKVEQGEIPDSFEKLAVSIIRGDGEFKKLSPQQKLDKLSDESQKMKHTTIEKPYEMTTGARTEIQKELMSGVKTIMTLGKISENHSKEFLTIPGKIKRKLLSFTAKGGEWVEKNLYKLDPKERRYLEEFQVWSNNLNRAVMQHVHDMSGAQYSIKELAVHKESLMNPDQDPYSFQAAYDSFKDDYLKGYRLKKYALENNKGLHGDELGKEIDKLYYSTIDPTLDPDYIDKIGEQYTEEIMASNPKMSRTDAEKRAAAKLYSEGYAK
jgi:hypothetical protein